MEADALCDAREHTTDLRLLPSRYPSYASAVVVPGTNPSSVGLWTAD